MDGATLVSEQQGQMIGRVICVSGSQIVALLEDGIEASGPRALPALQKGRLVKMTTPDSVVFGMINGLSIPVPAQQSGEAEIRIVEIEVLGETLTQPDGGQSQFQRGVSIFPSLGDAVYATSPDDLAQVYARPGVTTVRIGSLHQDKTIPATIAPDDLLGKHFAILGTTGSGKSCAVALILHAILDRHPNAHMVLLDPHNEYQTAFGETAEIIHPDSLQLPYWLLNFEELVEVILGGEEGSSVEAERGILSNLVAAAKRKFIGDGAEGMAVTVDTPIPYGISEVLNLIDEVKGKLDKPEKLAPYLNLRARIEALRADSRFGFIFGGIAVRDNMAKILSRILRIPVAGKPITIVDLSGVPSEILNVVVSVLSRITFDFALWSERAMPILLVCEEAHRYAPQDINLGFEPTKKALSRIAKEGRKYGVSLCVVSQRPSELATGVLSQCNTIFALRLSNRKDQDFVRAVMSDSAIGLLDFLPSLRNAEAIVVGEGVSVPLRLSFDRLSKDRRPLSGTASFTSAWQQDGGSEAFVASVVERWRRQRH